jgi:hypothetical protein
MWYPQCIRPHEESTVNCNGICPDSCNDIWPLWIPNTPFTLFSLGILDEYTQVKRGCTAGSSIGVHGHIAWQKCGQIPLQFTGRQAKVLHMVLAFSV